MSPSKRAVVVTVEGAENQPYVVRRDSDSYKGIHPLREKLTGSIYTVFLTLLDESRNAKSYQYILEIIQEPNFELRLNDAATWKSTHLGKFAREGIVFLEKLNDISKNAEEQIPFDTTPPPSLASMLTLGTEQPAPKMDYFDTVKRRDTIEREQEEKLIEPMKDWESRAADFVDLYIGADQSRQLKDCVPSFEAGLDRQKKFRRWRFTPPDGKPLPPESPNWKLFDAVMSRIDKLGEIGKGLR